MREFNELSIIEEKSKLHSEFHSYICKNTFKFREFRNERPIVFFFFFLKTKSIKKIKQRGMLMGVV